MLDIIHLLPDSIANQIAAGEVVQRPASVIKELLENSIDAKAQTIQVILKEAGRALIQIIDDGIGMSTTDARMSFERHATSKIRAAEDLFQIKTMGFRGEALASIAAVAQVELRSRRLVDELGVSLKIEGSDFKGQETISCPKGTNIQVKSLFYNVPARRNFLKSNPVEMKHILDEFQRIALAHPDISFALYHNDVEVYNLMAGKLTKRIVDIFGKTYREQLALCQEETPFVNVSGYIGKPESAKKGRGEQFFFVNERFIKHNYLHHAVLSAFEATIPEGSSPFYVLFLEIDPSHIDINIHPTKTEIKFDDERAVYAIIRSAVRKAVGVYNLTPTIDFESDINFGTISSGNSYNELPNPVISSKSSIQDFEKAIPRDTPREQHNTTNWSKLFEGLNNLKASGFEKNTNLFNETTSTNAAGNSLTLGSKANTLSEEDLLGDNEEVNAIQINGASRVIAVQAKGGLMLIDQRAAYERILYEKYSTELKKNVADGRTATSQQLLFPKTISLQAADYQLVLEIAEEIRGLGFMFEDFGGNSLIINGVPSEVQDENEGEIFEGLIQQFKNNESELKLDKSENLARAFAKRSAWRYTGELSKIEIKLLVHQLLETNVPAYTPSGEAIMTVLSVEKLLNLIAPNPRGEY